MNLSVRPSPLVTAATALALATVLGACAAPADDEGAEPSTTSSSSPTSSADPSPSRSPKPSAAPSTTKPAGPALAVTVKGDAVGPNADEISLKVGEPLTITFSADRPGELHVHSKPEQYVEFAAGKSDKRLVISTPGTVEIEEHDTGAVVAVVEVS